MEDVVGTLVDVVRKHSGHSGKMGRRTERLSDLDKMPNLKLSTFHLMLV